MSKVLVVVYSYTGTCRRLADELCDQQRWPMAEITDARPRSGALGNWRCLLDAWLRRTPAIHYRGLPAEDFDAVVLIAPVWAGRLAGPMRTFVASKRDRLPAVAMAPVMGGGGASEAIAEVERWMHRPVAVHAVFTSREVLGGTCAPRLRAFGKDVLANATGNASEGACAPEPQAA